MTSSDLQGRAPGQEAQSESGALPASYAAGQGNRRLTLFVILAMITGIATGFALNRTLDAGQAQAAAEHLSIITDIFLRLIKMIIAPLVLSTLVVGIAHMEDVAAIGRIGAKTMAWFVCASLVSLSVGLIMVHLLEPGVGLALTVPDTVIGDATPALSLKDFIAHIVPRSIFEALANNEILQIVIFSVFLGTAIASLDDRAPILTQAAEQVAQVMLRITGYVMLLAPLAVFAALAATVATQGISILVTYGKFVGGFYLSLGVLWMVLAGVTIFAVGRRATTLPAVIRAPVMLAFSTASSEAAYPRLLDALPRWGVPRRIVSFVLPLGYSFNLDGTMMYCTFAVMFIAQAYGISLSMGQQITMLLMLMVTSKGVAGVPRASLVVIASSLAYLKLPEAGLVLIVAVDHMLDMGRSATNVVGNSVAAIIVGKWEGRSGNAAIATHPSRSE